MTSLRTRTLLSRVDRLLSTVRYAVIGHFFIWVAGCVSIPKATAPLRTLHHRWSEAGTQRRLIVYLPGRGDKAQDFVEKGMWQSLRSRALPFDAIAVDAHLGYYLKGSIVARLMADVIQPAREQGYEEIWLAGNSLGGLGALLVEMENPGAIDKLLLFAPFLGDDKRLYRSFEQSDGVRNWNPGVEFAKIDFSPRLWLWLKDWPEQADNRPDTYLGFGDSDRLRLGIDHLAPLLPRRRVFQLPGGHRWEVWLPLWEQLLDASQADED